MKETGIYRQNDGAADECERVSDRDLQTETEAREEETAGEKERPREEEWEIKHYTTVDEKLAPVKVDGIELKRVGRLVEGGMTNWCYGSYVS